ncbi:hypothetical protein GCM10010404_92250 [Nonomuraea africana]|uniref:LuxR family transcriptional regulator n=1 Tax=Nonomuraea africana TaxID=46171 RepID=A0ABR9K6Y6_9ACTN|nr:ATP-binding protein [Nonomuraea africana]MBE1557665.1 hypothetical protein [Nonomuraea africana]
MGLAVLSLLAEAAAVRPVLVVADDMHWLDHSSADVLAFVARRIESEPVVMVATLRDGERSHIRDAGLTPMPLDRLSGEVAGELLDSIAPGLTPAVRVRLLRRPPGTRWR